MDERGRRSDWDEAEAFEDRPAVVGRVGLQVAVSLFGRPRRSLRDHPRMHDSFGQSDELRVGAITDGGRQQGLRDERECQ